MSTILKFDPFVMMMRKAKSSDEVVSIVECIDKLNEIDKFMTTGNWQELTIEISKRNRELESVG